MKNKLLLPILTCLLLLATTLLASGCDNTTNNTTTISNDTDIISIQVNVVSVYTNKGLEIMLIPRDSKGFVVEAEGTLNAKLWLQYGSGSEPILGDLICEWNNLQISKDDYTRFLGANIELIYTEVLDLWNAVGFLEVTFISPDGSYLVNTYNSILISKSSRC